MGEPAVVSKAEREAAWTLADEVVEAVLEDECGPCDLPFEFRRSRANAAGVTDHDWALFESWTAENEERIFSLAHEVAHLREDLELERANRQGSDGAWQAALTEALDGWEHLWRSDNNDEPPLRLIELRKLAAGERS